MMFIKLTCFKYNLPLILASLWLLFANLAIAQQAESPQVDSFTLVDADTGQTLVVYPNTEDVNSVSLPLEQAKGISFRFDTSNTGSVRISGVNDQSRVENHLPFSLLGDSDNKYEPWSPDVGVHQLRQMMILKHKAPLLLLIKSCQLSLTYCRLKKVKLL